MKVFLDTNVIADYLLAREPFYEDAINIFLMGNAGVVELLACDISFPNLAYITRKDFSKDAFYEKIEHLSRAIQITSVGAQLIELAVRERWDDFEDCIQYLSASRSDADCIVTRNTEDFRLSEIPVFTPTEFIDTILK